MLGPPAARGSGWTGIAPILFGALLTLGVVAAPLSSAKADDRLADLVERVAPSVVNLHLAGVSQPQNSWDLLFGGSRRWESLGSGFVIDRARSLVVTNEHVVGKATEISVATWDGRIFQAQLVGSDAELDLAVLSVPGLDLPAVTFGGTDSLRVGDDVFAVGNPYGHGHTVTRGILSARARSLGRDRFDLFLQTDAPINPGNSGGPLFDDEGRVIGVNTAVDNRAESIGFAMPVELVRGALPRLLENKPVVQGWVGLRLEDDPTGRLRIAAAYREGPGARAGLRAGDVVVAVDGAPAHGRTRWIERFGVAFPGDRRRVTVERGKERVDVELVLEDREAWAARVAGREVEIAAFGISVQPVPPDVADQSGIRQGVLVTRADRRAFFEVGDIVLAVNDSTIANGAELAAAEELVRAARVLRAVVMRGGRVVQVGGRF